MAPAKRGEAGAAGPAAPIGRGDARAQGAHQSRAARAEARRRYT